MTLQTLYQHQGDSIIRVSDGPAGELRVAYNRTICAGLLDRFEACVANGETWAIKHVEQLRKAIADFDEANG